MKSSIKQIFSLGLVTLFLSTAAGVQASPIVRGKVKGYNPTTGNAGRAVGGYNANTGARYYQVGGYNAKTKTYKGASGASNPVTGRGYNSNSTYSPASGYSGNVNTNNKGSYSCTATNKTDANCTKY